MRTALIPVLILAASCSRQDDSICKAPPPVTDKSNGACIHRTAYQYARATGPNSEIAKAVAASCEGALANAFADGPLKDIPIDKMDETYKMMRETAKETALSLVVQARAGNCDIPD